MRRRIKLALALPAAIALTVVAVGCGSSSGGDTTHPNYAKALAGAPAPLAKLYGEANRILPGGKDAFEKRVASLGYPVVANVWASWCGPCRFEFPMFQEMSAKFGKRVAFIGVDSEDSEKEAEGWLRDHPVPYPSYYETGFDYASSLKASGPPDTAFYNAKGELVHTKLGQYASAADLEEEIKQYALGGA
ncbi:MAG TPA: TlpA disulfide reductase family protein [Solirubrobacterales bacterium]|jgi:thiol-disulfide isomerase/thioredoxin